MDRTYSSPRDVGNATPDDVTRTLSRVLRRVEGRAQFVYQAEFEYANGRKAPLLMVGALRGPWREFVRRNAGAAGFAAGECEVHRDEEGRLQVRLHATRGRGAGPSHERAINAGPMRRAGGSARFVESLGEAPAAAASTGSGTAGSEPAAGGGDAAGAGAEIDPKAEVAAINRQFAEFKAGPTAEKLEALEAAIARWRELGGSFPDGAVDAKDAQRVEAMAKLVAEKGRAYVERKGGG